MNRKTLNILSGFVLGVVFLHPLSMAFQGLVHPALDIRVEKLPQVFSVHHLPMALLFGLVGAIFVLLHLSYASRLLKKERRVQVLEGLLPICAYCRKIREADKPAEDRSAWHEMEHYLSLKADASFTHGMCPECYDRLMEELDDEEAKKV